MKKITIDQQRLWNSLMEMAKIGATEKGGCCRLALTELDKQGRDLFIQWCKDAGCTIHIDQMGNIFARREGTLSATDSDVGAICTGSHLDTQPTGGKFDGIYGCLAGLEVIRSLNDADQQTQRAIEVSVWTNEEGSRFAPAMVASGVFSGKFTLEYAHNQCDNEGISLLEALKEIDYLGTEPVGARNIHRFFELHIEQGPVLEAEKLDIGVVTGVLGMRWYDVKVQGTSAHAGPTPMNYRNDALYASSKILSKLYELAQKDSVGSARCTVGELNIDKSSRNVIPGELSFSLDLRHANQTGLDNLEMSAEKVIADISALTGTQITLNKIWDSAPLAFDENCITAVDKAAQASGFSFQKLVSGAGHDAVNISSVAPTSMIFVPSIGGISHNEAEYSSPEQLAKGCQILLDVMQQQADQ